MSKHTENVHHSFAFITLIVGYLLSFDRLVTAAGSTLMAHPI